MQLLIFLVAIVVIAKFLVTSNLFAQAAGQFFLWFCIPFITIFAIAVASVWHPDPNDPNKDVPTLFNSPPPKPVASLTLPEARDELRRRMQSAIAPPEPPIRIIGLGKMDARKAAGQ